MSLTYNTEPGGIDVVHVQFLTLLLFQLGSKNIANLLRDMVVGLLMGQCAWDRSHSVRELTVPAGVTEYKTANIAVEASMATSLTVIAEFTRHEICWCISGSRAVSDLDL